MTGGRADGRTGGHAVLLAALLSVCPSARLPAQVSLHASAGARFSTALVHDSIVNPVDVKPTIAPTIALSLSETAHGSWTPDATLDVSFSTLQRHENGTTSKILSLTTIGFTVGFTHAIKRGLTGRVGVGALKYLPSEQAGLFRDGSSITALGAASVQWLPNPTSKRAVGLTLRYDVHGFTTPALRTEGFTSRQAVHRLYLGINARLLGGGGSP